MNFLISVPGFYSMIYLEAQIADKVNVGHSFTTAFCSWAICTVKRLLKVVLHIAKASFSERTRHPHNIPVYFSPLNTHPTSLLSNNSVITKNIDYVPRQNNHPREANRMKNLSASEPPFSFTVMLRYRIAVYERYPRYAIHISNWKVYVKK